MMATANRAFLDRYLDAWNAHDPAAVARHMVFLTLPWLVTDWGPHQLRHRSRAFAGLSTRSPAEACQ